MAHYYGPKVRLSRGLEAPIAETPKHTAMKRPKTPGQHGYRRGRVSLYSVQLREKQKFARYYNIRDVQLRRYAKEAQSARKPSVEVLEEILETRLDNVVRRLRWARTIWQARQMVVHGHFLVNGRKVDLPSFYVKAGDTISVKEDSKQFVRRSDEATEGMGFSVPDWLSVDQDKMEATVLHKPKAEEIMYPFEVDCSRIIEFYTR